MMEVAGPVGGGMPTRQLGWQVGAWKVRALAAMEVAGPCHGRVG